MTDKDRIINKIYLDTHFPKSVISNVIDSLKDAILDDIIMNGKTSIGWLIIKVHKDGKPRAHLRIGNDYKTLLNIYKKEIL